MRHARPCAVFNSCCEHFLRLEILLAFVRIYQKDITIQVLRMRIVQLGFNVVIQVTGFGILIIYRKDQAERPDEVRAIAVRSGTGTSDSVSPVSNLDGICPTFSLERILPKLLGRRPFLFSQNAARPDYFGFFLLKSCS